MEIVKVVGAWALVVLGWMIVSDQQEKRELAKNGYTRINALREGLRSLSVKAINHHTNKFDEGDTREIMRALKIFYIEISHLRKHNYLQFSTANDAFAFRQALTGRNFDSGSYVTQPFDSEIVADIELATDSLDRQLLESAHRISCDKRTLRDSVSNAFKRL